MRLSDGARWLTEGWRTWLYLLIGGALLVPLSAVLTALLWPVTDTSTLLALWLGCAAGAALAALVPAVRTIEGFTARDLLGLTGAGRAGAPGLYALAVTHLVLGATHSAATLFLVGPTVWFAAAGRPSPVPGSAPWSAAVLALALWAASLPVARLLLRALGRRLLRPDPARRLEELGRRDALARDLHDSLGHALAVISVQASALDARLGPAADGAVRDNVAVLAGASRQAQAELDQALGLLSEDLDGGSPGLESAPRLVAVAAPPGNRTRPVTLDGTLTPRQLSALDRSVSRTAYRILQEAVANALRHAVGPVEVSLRVAGQLLLLDVRSGPPAEPGPAPRGPGRQGPGRQGAGGSGLAGMRRRAMLVGGTLQVEESPAGWTVRAELPR